MAAAKSGLPSNFRSHIVSRACSVDLQSANHNKAPHWAHAGVWLKGKPSSFLLWFSFSWKLKIFKTWPWPKPLVAASFRWYLKFTANRLSVSEESHLLELLTTRKLSGKVGICFQFGKLIWQFNQKDHNNEVLFVPAGKMWNSNTLWYKCLGVGIVSFSFFLFFYWQLPASKAVSPP